jgi:hypothetical protein
MERKSCTNKTMKISNYNVLNAEQSLNSRLKTKNFIQQKVTLHQKDALNVVKEEKQLKMAAALEAASVETEKEENSL